MQIGIDLGATKIEYVLLDNNNKEIKRDRIPTPSDYQKTLLSLEDIMEKNLIIKMKTSMLVFVICSMIKRVV